MHPINRTMLTGVVCCEWPHLAGEDRPPPYLKPGVTACHSVTPLLWQVSLQVSRCHSLCLPLLPCLPPPSLVLAPGPALSRTPAREHRGQGSPPPGPRPGAPFQSPWGRPRLSPGARLPCSILPSTMHTRVWTWERGESPAPPGIPERGRP